jgi:hypothetical protein
VERSRCLEARSQPNNPSMTMPTEHSVQAQRYKRSFNNEKPAKPSLNDNANRALRPALEV